MNISMVLLSAAVLGSCGSMPPSHGSMPPLLGRIDGGEYTSPDTLFRVDVPVMRNPFVKEPSLIHDERRPDGGADVTFSVLELGEAWRFGAGPFSSALPHEARILGDLCDSELERWTKTPAAATVVLEETAHLEDGPALARIYYVESASLLFVRQGEGDAGREGALIGVKVTLVPQQQRVLYAIGQFDMPNRGGHYTLETDRGRTKLAEEQLKRLRELSSSLRPQ